jgi:hypothetical protein
MNRSIGDTLGLELRRGRIVTFPEAGCDRLRRGNPLGGSARVARFLVSRLSATVSPMRCAGAPISIAIRQLLMPSGFKNSSASISPGDTDLSFLVISSCFSDRPRCRRPRRRFRSSKSNPELIVHLHAPLACTSPFQLLE